MTDRSTAIDIAEQVRTGRRDPRVAVDAALARIAELDPRIGAFQVVTAEAARAAAAALADRPDLAELPLAGVPVAIKDTVAVAGQPTRYGSAASDPTPATTDDERFGTTVIKKTTLGAGSALKGWEGFDFMLSGNHFSYATEVNRLRQPGLSNSQWRTNVRIMKRIIDEEVTPGRPSSALTSLQVVVPLRHDKALTGPTDYENARGGIELWAKLLAPGLRGSTFLLNASVEAQYFYRIDKVIALAQLGVRMGWPSFGTLPAFF